jgi:hypothetical protein
MDILLVPASAAPVVTFLVVVHVGSRNEAPGNTAARTCSSTCSSTSPPRISGAPRERRSSRCCTRREGTSRRRT